MAASTAELSSSTISASRHTRDHQGAFNAADIQVERQRHKYQVDQQKLAKRSFTR